MKRTRIRIVALSVLGAVALIVWGAFLTPLAHEVHTPGATAVSTQFVVSDKYVPFRPQPIPPSHSLDTVRCDFWRDGPRPTNSSCPDTATLDSLYFTNLKQSPKTLYLPWRGCWSVSRGWDGLNVEYLPGSRTLVIHCYASQALFVLPRRLTMGVQAAPQPALLLVPTDSLSAGPLSIVEDDRIERLAGDRSTEFQLATAMI